MPESHELDSLLPAEGLEDVDEHDDYARAIYEQAEATMAATPPTQRNLEPDFERVEEGGSRFIRIEEAHFPGTEGGDAPRSRNADGTAEELLQSLDQQIKLTESQLDSLNEISQHAGSFYMLRSEDMEGRDQPPLPDESSIVSPPAQRMNARTVERKAKLTEPAPGGSIKAYVEKRDAIIPVFETSLVGPKKEEQKQKIAKPKKALPRVLPTTARKKQSREKPEEPLIKVKVKLGERTTVEIGVTSVEETGMSLAERALSNAQIEVAMHVKRRLAEAIEKAVSEKIEKLVKLVRKQNARLLNTRRQREQERLEAAVAKGRAPSLEVDKRSQKKRKPIIGKLAVIIGSSKKGEITIREDDEPAALVRSFMHSYNLKRDQMPRILQSVRELIERSKALAAQEEAEQLEKLESSMRYEAGGAGGERAVLFRLNFELGGGKTAKITVREGDNLVRLAHQFCITHKLLSDETHRKVQLLLQQTLALHYQRG